MSWAGGGSRGKAGAIFVQDLPNMERSRSRSRSPQCLGTAAVGEGSAGASREDFIAALREDGDQCWSDLKAMLDKLPRESLVACDQDRHTLLYFAARAKSHALKLVGHIQSLWQKHSFVPPSDVMCDALSSAAFGGNTQVCKHVLDSAVDVNIANERGRTALFYAVIIGSCEELARIDTAQMLIKQKADVHHRDQDKQTPLFFAASSTYSSESVELLLKRGADPDALDVNARNAVFNAAMAGHEAGIPNMRLLVRAKADVHRLDKFKCNALRFAIKSSRGDAAMVLLQEFGAGLPMSIYDVPGGGPDLEGDETCLLMAQERGLTAVRDHLLTLQACFETVKAESAQRLHALISSYPTCRVNTCGKTLLHEAATRTDREAGAICDLLINTYGMSVNAIDYGGRTPLFAAAQHGSLHATKFLLKAQADANVRDHGGSPLFYAVRGGKATPNVVTALLRAMNDSSKARTVHHCRRDFIRTRDREKSAAPA